MDDIEETNRIRKELGLAPLPVSGQTGPIFKSSIDDANGSDDEPGSTLESRAAQGFENFKKLQDEKEKQARKQAKKEMIRKASEKAARERILQGKGLGDEDEGGDEDARTWIKNQKKRQKNIEKMRRLQEEIEERDKAALAAEYTSKDLAGVKVAHEVDQFDVGTDQVLTLKDQDVLMEDEDDELENLDVKAKEKIEERLRLKKKRPDYDPMADEGTGQKSILSKYDEEIEGKKKKRFTLDGQGSTQEAFAAAQDASSSIPGRIKINLDMIQGDKAPTSDYMDVSEIKVKKPKKRKSKPTRKKVFEADEEFTTATAEPNGTGDAMEIDQPQSNGAVNGIKKRNFNESYVDDDDLQDRLAIQRANALKKRKTDRAKELARQFQQEDPVQSVEGPSGGQETGLVVDNTSEFVNQLQVEKTPPPVKPAPPSKIRQRRASSSEDEDVHMSNAGNFSDSDEEKARKARTSATPAIDVTNTGFDEEATVDQGVGGTLKMLRDRGIVTSGEGKQSMQAFRQQQVFKDELRKRLEENEIKAKEDRDRLRHTGRWEYMTNREREEYGREQNARREQIESRLLADMFNRQYKPTVNLNYVDEHGRHMSQKEAFKSMSHMFHGKGSGKGKTDKKLKKIEDEKRKMAESTLEAKAAGYDAAQGERAKRIKSAGVRLQ